MRARGTNRQHTEDEKDVSQDLSVIHLKTIVAGWWWNTPLIWACGKQRQVDFLVWSQSGGLQSELQDSQGYPDKLCLGEKKIIVACLKVGSVEMVSSK